MDDCRHFVKARPYATNTAKSCSYRCIGVGGMWASDCRRNRSARAIRGSNRRSQRVCALVNALTFVPATFLFMIGLLLQIFGCVALYGYLIDIPSERWAFFGMILTVTTDALLLAMVGTFAYAFPSIGRLYLQGQANVLEVTV